MILYTVLIISHPYFPPNINKRTFERRLVYLPDPVPTQIELLQISSKLEQVLRQRLQLVGPQGELPQRPEALEAAVGDAADAVGLEAELAEGALHDEGAILDRQDLVVAEVGLDEAGEEPGRHWKCGKI